MGRNNSAEAGMRTSTSVSIFERLFRMCELSEGQMLNAMPIMLKGDALSYFSTNMNECKPYPDATDLLKWWY